MDNHSKINISVVTAEIFFAFCIFLSIAAQLILGESNHISTLLRLIAVPGLIFASGYSTAKKDNNKYTPWIRPALCLLMFLFFGMCNQVLLNHKPVVTSLAKLLTLTKIPRPSDIFFTLGVFYVCAIILSKCTEWFDRHKTITILAGLLAVLAAYIPSGIFGYPLMGVFLGCDTYDCIPLLPYAIFFIWGLMEGQGLRFRQYLLPLSAVLLVLSFLLKDTAAGPAAQILFAAFPVYVCFLVLSHIPLFEKLADICMSLYRKLSPKLTKMWQGLSENDPRMRPLYFILYTFAFLVLSFFVFLPFIENGRSIIWMHDAIAQYVPKAYYFIQYVHDAAASFLAGNFELPAYDFTIGMGSAISFSFEPLYWVLALFDSSHVELAYNFLTVLRIYAAGISASIFFFYFKRSYYETFLGSMVYTFSGFAIYAGVLHGQFISPLILLPLLIVATEEIFRKKRWYLCTILVAVSLYCTYYFLYINTIVMGIYFLARFIFTKDREKKNIKYFFQTACTFGFSYLLGVVIGNTPLFTQFASYVSSGRSSSSTIATPSLFYYDETWVLDNLISFISTPISPGYWLKLGFVPLCYIAVVVLFLKKEKKILKFFFFLFSAFCLFPFAGYVFSGVSSVTNRWTYAFALLTASITVYALPKLKSLTHRELKIIFLSFAPYFLIILFYEKYRTAATLTALAVLLCCYLLILFMNDSLGFLSRKTAYAALALLCMLSLGFNGYYQYTGGKNSTYTGYARRGKALEEIRTTPLSVFEDFEDDSFYRVSTGDMPREDLSSSYVLGFNGITMFSSTIPSPVLHYNQELGNTAWNLTQIYGFDNRAALNALAGVKYHSDTAENEAYVPYGYEEISTEEANGNEYHVYENKYALPLGYTYSDVITEQELSAYASSEKQEIMLQAAVVGDDSEISESLSHDFSLNTANLPITEYEADGVEIKGDTVRIPEAGGTLTLHFDGLANAETYLEFHGSCDPGSSGKSRVVNVQMECGDYSKTYSIRSSNHTYTTGQDSFVFNLGYQEEGTNQCKITFLNSGRFTLDSFKVYCQPMDSYSSYISALSEDILTDVEITGSTVSGNISLDADKLLTLSIPYQKGWTAYVDGQEASLEKVNLMYMGIMLDAGEHQIELRYERPGVSISLLLSGAGLLIFIAALIIRRRRIKMKKETKA